MSYRYLTLAKQGPLARLTLNRPENFNSFHIGLGEELQAAVRECEDEQVRAVLISGAGKHFCAGGDVKWMRDNLGEDFGAAFDALIDACHPPIMALRNLLKPVIAAIQGFASGAGFSLAMACDYRIAAENAKFNQAYVNIGLSPDCGSSYFLTRALGPVLAIDLIFTGRVVAAEEALRLGIVNQVVPQEEFAQTVEQVAASFANGPTKAYAAAKLLVNKALENDLATQLALEQKLVVENAQSDDFSEGLQAFFEKRPTRFIGK